MTSAAATPGRNDPCTCGSGRKFKVCCGSVERQASSRGPAAVTDAGAQFQRALSLYHEGLLTEAQQVCRSMLRRAPNDVDALNLTGVIACRLERYEWAEKFFRHALSLRPFEPQFHLNLGGLYRQQARLAEAESALRQALRYHPGYREARLSLALTLSDGGTLPEANACLAELLAEAPEVDGALALSTELAVAGKRVEAQWVLERALERRGADVRLLEALAGILLESKRLPEAETCLRSALETGPGTADLHAALGNVLLGQGRFEAAETSLREALELEPEHAFAHCHLARKFFLRRDPVQAEAHAFRALAQAPQWPEAHLLLGEALLVQGRLADGWAEYEWRWEEEPYTTLKHSLTTHRWNGEPLEGRSVLLHFEQGFGDTIQFARYASLVQSRGGDAVLFCQPALARLLRSLDGGIRVIDHYDELPPHDFYCPLISLPRIFGTTLATVPGRVPYLKAEPADVQRWRSRLSPDGRPRVGIVWSGNPRYGSDEQRSIAWPILAPLLDNRNVQWVSLQKLDSEADERFRALPGLLDDSVRECRDFADTAALIETLDLVIGVDTSVIHLAGALGKPVWLLNRFATDWRWLMYRDDSPWYPTLRIFRQPSFGDWPSVIETIGSALADWVPAHPACDAAASPSELSGAATKAIAPAKP